MKPNDFFDYTNEKVAEKNKLSFTAKNSVIQFRKFWDD